MQYQNGAPVSEWFGALIALCSDRQRGGEKGVWVRKGGGGEKDEARREGGEGRLYGCGQEPGQEPGVRPRVQRQRL